MSGAVKTAVNAFMSIPNAAISGVKAAASGEDLPGIVTKTARGALNPVLHANNYEFGGVTEKPGTASKGLFGAPDPVPNVAIEDPAAVAQADAQKRAAAKRQTQIDILTGQPGRGGTILTDNYQYKV